MIVWISFIPICCSKVAKEGKRCSRLLALQKVAQNAKSCSKVAEHNIFMPSLDKTAVQLLIPGRFTLIIWMKSNLKDNSEILQKRNPLSVRWENRYKGGTGDFSAVAGQNVVFGGGRGE